MQLYGYPVLWLCVFVSAVGLPLPTSLVLLAAGAFASLGDFNIFLLLPVAITASTMGDSLGYWLGRRVGSRLLDWLERRQGFSFISPRAIVRSRAFFNQRGGWAIFLTRFLFSALGGVTNLLAGADLYPYNRFLVSDLIGETLGALIPLGLGYIFGESWEAIGDLLGAFSGLAFALLIVIVLVVYLMKMLRRMKYAPQKAHVQKVKAQEETPLHMEIPKSGISAPLPVPESGI